VRYIDYDKVVETVESLCISACHELGADVRDALQRARRAESNPTAATILDQLIDNAELAAEQQIPLCQDTGVAVVFVELGAAAALKPPPRKPNATLVDAVNQGVAAGYQQGYLRKSIVAEPLNQRQNTGTNTPALIHFNVVPGDKLKLTVMAKGGGCENRSAFRMFNPTAGRDQIIQWVADVAEKAGADACPPFIIGVGIGGDFELSCLLAKKALLRRLDNRHPDPFYAQLEEDLLAAVNALGIGPGGFGGDTTALACLVETAPCHIASLPAAVNIDCHAHRHKSAVI